MIRTTMARIIRRNTATYLRLLTLLWGVSWFLYCHQALMDIVVIGSGREGDVNVDGRSVTTYFLPSPEERERISIPPLSSISSTRRQKAVAVTLAPVESNGATPRSNNLWENNTALPVWMKEYFDWHHEQVSQLNETNWKSQRYLVLRCLKHDRKCGGAADRLRIVPVAVLVACQFDRILLIQWERPCPLTEFLVPPTNGVDWRIPTWLEERLEFRKRPYIMTLNQHARDLLLQSPDLVLADMLLQINDHGASYYQTRTSNAAFTLEDIYHHVWEILFQPSPAVASLINQHMQEQGLIENNYAAVHIRSQYLRDKSSAKHAPHFRNAVHCASQLHPAGPIWITSDSAAVTEYAVKYGREKAAASAAKMQQGGTAVAVVARPTSNNSTSPLHLDRGSDYLVAGALTTQQMYEQEATRQPSDYYEIFVDLYLLARSKCIALHTGGYGRWARLMSHTGAGQCWINHGTNRCQWTSSASSKNSSSIR